MAAGDQLVRYGELFLELLLLVEAGVVAVARQQFLMPAELHDSTAIEHCNLIGIAHCGDTM